MANLSQQKRERMLAFLETLKTQHTDDDSLIALGEIEKELKSKKYGLVWEEHEEAVDVMMKTHIPVFTEASDMEINGDPSTDSYNFLLEGDNLHSLRLLEKTHRGKIDVIYIDPPYNTGSRDFRYDDAFVDSLDGFRHSKWLSFTPRQILDEMALGAAYAYLSADDVVKLAELLGGLVHHSEDILGTFAQEHTFIVKYHILIGADKQFMPQFFLKLLYLFRQRGLRDMQALGRPCHVFFSCNGKKIS